MFLNKNRVFTYFISLVIVFIALYTMPLNQPIKYIIFIIINFFLITSASKKNYNLSKKLLVFLLIFISSVFIINNLNLKFSFDIKSFNKENSEKLLTSSIEFFEKNYPECIKINCFGSNPYQVTLNNSFYRNNLDINNTATSNEVTRPPGDPTHLKNWLVLNKQIINKSYTSLSSSIQKYK